MLRAFLAAGFLLCSTPIVSAQAVTCLIGPCGLHRHHRVRHHDCCSAPLTEYRGYYGYSGPDGYRIWEGDVEPGFGEERWGENGGTVHYGE